MTISRRDFLKLGGAAAAGLLLPLDVAAAAGGSRFPLHKRVGEAASVCPYCSVGCGLLLATDAQGHVTNCEGDPDNIHNRGALFSLKKGHSNALEPGKRPFQTIIPAFLTKDGQPLMAFGLMGGDMQPQGHVQVVVNLVDMVAECRQPG